MNNEDTERYSRDECERMKEYLRRMVTEMRAQLADKIAEDPETTAQRFADFAANVMIKHNLDFAYGAVSALLESAGMKLPDEFDAVALRDSADVDK